MKKYLLLITGYSIAIASCQFDTDPKTLSKNNLLDKQASWLLGKWENQTESGKSIEYWHKINDSVYRSQSFIIDHGDTISSEEIDLINKNNSLE